MKQPIPISKINAANNTARLNALLVWVRLKKEYKQKPFVILDYKKIAETTGISHTTIRKRVKELADLGMVNVNDGVLHLKGINSLKRHCNEKCVLIPVEQGKGKQILQFRKAIVHQNLSNQAKSIKEKKAIVNNCSKAHGKLRPKQLRAISRAGGVKKFAASLIDVTTLSNKRFGALFGKSQRTGLRIQKSLRESNLIETKVRLELVIKEASITDMVYLSNRIGGCHIYNYINGNVFRRLSNQVAIKGCNK